jgi:accessory gene regulator B
MVERLSIAIVNQIKKENFLDKDMEEQYVYALITITEKWLTVATIIGISVFSKKVIPTILFLMFFLSLRKLTGGFHAKEFWQCYIGTIATYIVINITMSALVNHLSVIYVLVIISVIVIGIIGTINHPNMALDCYELQESKKAARYMLGLECMFFVAFTLLSISKVCTYYMSVAIILCALLLCLAQLIKQEVK